MNLGSCLHVTKEEGDLKGVLKTLFYAYTALFVILDLMLYTAGRKDYKV